MTTFERQTVIAELADELWRYLSPDASHGVAGVERDVVLGGLGDDEARNVLTAHLPFARETLRMLDAAPGVVERLPSVVARRVAELDGEVEGEIDHRRTMERRLETGFDTLFVCSPVERRFESLHARVLKTALVWCERIGRSAPYTNGTLRTEMERSAERARQVQLARRTGHSLKLAGVRPLTFPTPAQLERVEHRFGLKEVVEYVRFVSGVLEHRDPTALASLFHDVILAPARNDRLFELKVGFGLVKELAALGWRVSRLQAFAGSGAPFAELSRDGEELTIWDQRSLGSIPGLGGDSFYRKVRVDNGLKPSSLRPDFTVCWSDGRVFLIEVKLSDLTGQSHVRAGIVDVLAYLRDRPDLFAAPKGPYAAVVAWGGRSSPNDGSEVIVASEVRLPFLATTIAGQATASPAQISAKQLNPQLAAPA